MDMQSLYPPKSFFIQKLASQSSEKWFAPVPGFYKMMRFILVTVSLILTTPVSADEGYYLLGGIGASTTRIKSEYLVNSWNDTSDNLDFQLSLGYQFNNNVLIELTSISHESIDLFGFSDSASVYEMMALLGYSFDINERFRITPRMGYSRWRVESSEGFMFNPGPEITTSKKGSDLTYMLSASYRILYLTLQSVDYEFGSLHSVIIGVKFEL